MAEQEEDKAGLLPSGKDISAVRNIFPDIPVSREVDAWVCKV